MGGLHVGKFGQNKELLNTQSHGTIVLAHWNLTELGYIQWIKAESYFFSNLEEAMIVFYL